MVIHDLKTPLSAILGAISFLSTDPDVILSPITENLLTGAMAAGNQMVRLTETLLESQRLEHGHLEPDSEPFHFPTIVDVSLKQLASLLTLHRVTVDVNLEPEHLPLAYADPHISQRILENLLDNAIKFSPRNGKITMEMVQEGNFLRISVSDQGPGIPKEDQQTIFEQFAQLKREDSSYSRGGFGLGLTFCHLAAHAMGGTIWVESDGQSGTKFSFTIPIFVEQ
jgi:two-component system sensor histidine kinase KdpD